MNKRYAVLGLSVFLALALAVPALGGPSNPVANISASAKSIANKALKKAKTAQSTAESAQNTANAASSAAGQAQSEAKKAQSTANNAQTAATTAKATADAAKTAATNAQNTANAAQSTANAAQSAATAANESATAANNNANTRIKESIQVAGESTGESTTTPKFTSVSCPSGDPVLGGGFSVGGESNKVTVTQSEEQLYGGGWFVDASTINGQGAATWSLLAIATCGVK